jgi:coenzyme F420-reducing hydrogenase beta subunit
MSVKLRNGIERHIPFMSINAYRQAGIHAKDLCAWCYEHKAEDADLSVGDIFMPEFKQKPIKHSAFIARSEKAVTLLENMQSEGILVCRYVGIERYKKSFAKVERFSNSLSPRSAAARLIGLKFLKATKKIDNFNLFHFLAWTIIFLNKRISLSRRGRRFLFALPSLLIYLVAALVKGLSRM